MLQRLRDKAQGWIAWVIIGMIAITFILFGTGSMFNSSPDSEKIVAKVNGIKISARELDNVYQRYLHQPGAESLRNLDASSVKKELLQSLIEEAAMLNAAMNLGIRVSPQRISNTLSGIPFLQEEGHFSSSAYARFLANANYSDQGFRTLLGDSLVKQQLQQGLTQTPSALPKDVELLIKYILQKRDFRFTTISSEPFEKSITITNEDLKQFYDNHLKDFLTEEQISLEYVQLSLPELMNEYHPEENDAQNFYRENASMFSEPERVHVAHILVAIPKNADAAAVKAAEQRVSDIQKKLQEGSSFESLAQKYSDDKASSQSGGDLKWFERNEMVPEFERAAFALEKKGEISSPVRTEFGIHFIVLIDKQKEKLGSFAEVKDEIRVKLKQQWAEEQLATQADKLATLAFDHPDSLQAAHSELGLTIKKTDLFSRKQGPKEPILQQPAVVNTAFNSSVKEDKNNSDLLKLDDENYIVLRVAQYIPAKQRSFEEVKPEIQKLMLSERGDLEAKNAAQTIIDAIMKNKDNESKILSQYPWQEKNQVVRTSNEINASLVGAAFSMPRPTNKPDLKLVRLDNGDYAIVWLINVVDGDYARLSTEDKKNYSAALRKHYGELEYELYAKEVSGSANVSKYLDKI